MGKWITGFRLALAALLAVPVLAQAAGLGRLTVQSALGQPLNAEIEIVSLQPGEDDSLVARLASQEAFRQAGIEMSPALVGVRFAIERRAGRPVIRLSTLNPVNEPFLDLLVELQWATGRLVREYTFLLDPPEYKGPQPIAAAPPVAKPAPAPAAEPARPVPPVETRPITAAPSPAPAPAPSAAAPAGSYEVKKGDTLGAIARDNRPAGVTFNQMLIALYRANQAAFIRDNINLVRAGRILTIPDRNAIEAVDAAEANRLVQTHHAEFAEYRRQLGAAVAAAPAPAPREREVAGRITAKPGAPAPAEGKDQLRLSRADPAKPGAPGARAAREDDRIARERALQDAQSRVGDLEKNVGDLQKLLEIKNQQLAELEKKAGPKPAAPEAPKPAPDAPKPAAEAPKPAAEAPKPAAEAPKPAPEAAKAPESPKPAAEAPKPAAPKPKAAPPPPPPPPSLVDEFLDNPVALSGLGAVVVLLAGYGIWAWRRKKATQTKFQDSVLAAPGAAAGGAAAVAGTAAGSPDTTISRAAPGAAVETEEVDPIAEADVYMAYGRDAQAEEILKEALGKDANRVPVLLKLLEIYSGRRDTRSFEQTALKVKNLTNGAGPEWEKAAALGRSLDPASGLYGGSAADATQAMPQQPGATTTLDFDIGGEAPATPAPGAATTLDFDLGATSPGIAKPAGEFTSSGTLIMDKPAAAPQAPAAALDFNLGDTTTLRAQTIPAPAAAAAKPDNTIDFDLNLDLGGAKSEAAAPAAAEAPVDLGSINLDLGAPAAGASGAGDAKWQEVSTKLDLAKAYEEMGDKDGARELLNEVLREGDAAQQGQAKQMLAHLG